MQGKYISFGLFAILANARAAVTPDWRDLRDNGARFEREGHLQDAVANYRAAIQLVAHESPKDDRLPDLLDRLASACIGLGAYVEAEESYKHAVAIMKAAGRRETGEYATLLTHVASLYAEQNELRAAEKAMREAVVNDRGIYGDEGLPTLDATNELAHVLLRLEQFGEVDALLQRIIPSYTTRPNECVRCYAGALNNLGVLRQRQRRLPEAAEIFKQSLTVLAVLGSEHPLLLRPLVNLGETLAALGRMSQAEQTCQRAIAIARARFGVSHPFYAEALTSYGIVLRKFGRKAEAKAVEAEAKMAWTIHYRNNRRELVVDVATLSR